MIFSVNLSAFHLFSLPLFTCPLPTCPLLTCPLITCLLLTCPLLKSLLWLLLCPVSALNLCAIVLSAHYSIRSLCFKLWACLLLTCLLLICPLLAFPRSICPLSRSLLPQSWHYDEFYVNLLFDRSIYRPKCTHMGNSPSISRPSKCQIMAVDLDLSKRRWMV